MKSLLRVLIVLSCVSISAGCHDWHFKYFGIVDPSPVVAVRPFVNPFSIFRADLTVVTVTTVKSCAVIFTPGQIFPGTHTAWHHGVHPEFFQGQTTLHQLVTTPLDGAKGVGAANDQEVWITARLQSVRHALDELL